MPYVFANDFASTIASGIAPSAVGLTLASGDGARFRALLVAGSMSSTDVLQFTIEAGSLDASQREVLTFTGPFTSGDILGTGGQGTLVRGNASLTWTTGARIFAVAARDALRSMIQPDRAFTELLASVGASPSTPPGTGNGKIFLRDFANIGIPFLAARDSTGLDWLAEVSGMTHFVSRTSGVTSASEQSLIGMQRLNNQSGTLAIISASDNPSSVVGESFRQSRTAAASNNAIAGFSGDSQSSAWRTMMRGNATGRGGYLLYARVGLEAVPGAGRAFFGMYTTALIANSFDPASNDVSAAGFNTTSAYLLGITAEAADTNLKIFAQNGQTGGTTALSTVTAFSTALDKRGAASGGPGITLVDLIFACAPSNGTTNTQPVRCIVRSITAAAGYTWTTNADVLLDPASVNLPGGGRYLRPVLAVSNGAQSASLAAMSLIDCVTITPRP